MDTPAIVLGLDATALGVTRTLARQGVPTVNACPSHDAVEHSRYFRPAVTRSGTRWLGEVGDQGLALMQDLPFERAVIIPCSDVTAEWVATIPESLRERFPSSNPSRDAIDLLQDKRRFASLCRDLAVPHPMSFMVESEADLDGIPFADIEAAFFKPFNSKDFSEIFGTRGIWIDGLDEARAAWRRVAEYNIPMLVQGYVAGGSDQHYFIDGYRDRDGAVRAIMARRRLRMASEFGNSSYCVQTDMDDVRPAAESLQKILATVDYHGIFSAEFKQDTRDGQFKILEINTRAWTYVEFATWCGVDVCQLAYREALDMPLYDQYCARSGVGCVNAFLDFHAVRGMPRAERPSWFRVVLQWFMARKHVFSISDPGPWLHWLRGKLQSRRGGQQPYARPVSQKPT